MGRPPKRAKERQSRFVVLPLKPAEHKALERAAQKAVTLRLLFSGGDAFEPNGNFAFTGARTAAPLLPSLLHARVVLLPT
jgi:hypothetical protein